MCKEPRKGKIPPIPLDIRLINHDVRKYWHYYENDYFRNSAKNDIRGYFKRPISDRLLNYILRQLQVNLWENLRSDVIANCSACQAHEKRETEIKTNYIIYKNRVIT